MMVYLIPFPFPPPQINVPPGILVYVFQSPLCFLNAAVFTENLEAAVGIKPKRNGLEKNGCVKQIITKVGSIVYNVCTCMYLYL